MGSPQYKKDDSYSTDTNNKSRLNNVSRASRARSARINDDWEYLNEPELSAYPTADETFNASYKEKGIRSKDTEDKKQEKKVVELVESRAQAESSGVISRNIHNKAKILKLPAGASSVKKLKWKAKATTVNISILSWYTWVWLTLQLSFGILGLIFFGVAATIAKTSSSSTILSIADEIFSSVTGSFGNITDYIGLTESASEGISVVDTLIAIPLNLFMISYLVIFAVGILSIFIVFLQYELALLKPFSGDHASLKIGSFMAVIVLYAIPILNIFPWLLLWMFVVWRYPR